MSVFRVTWEGSLAHLVMDHPERRVNVLDHLAIGGLEDALAEVEAKSGLAGVILESGKPGSFIAGADIEAIGALTDRDVVRGLIRRAHAVFGRLAALPVPTVAAIDGVCLGGGTELALACDSRVATLEAHTQIGLPEVLLGLFPGFGGSVRLPKLVGLSAALDLILTGRSLDAKRAERMGLVGRAVPAAWLRDAVHARLEQLAKRPAGRRRDAYRPHTFLARAVDGNPFGRALAFQQARAGVLKRTGGHYPAPLEAIATLERIHGQPEAVALTHEADAVSALIVGPVCKNLVRIFQLSEDAKRRPVTTDPAVAAADVRRMALVGAGVMGGGIAELASRSGVGVRLRDVRPESLQKALQTVRGVIDERGRRRRMSAREKDGQMARILPTLELTGIRHADLAIEAVVEDLDVKRRVYGELEVRIPATAVLATNTSSLSVNELADGLAHPERFVGIHFFNPVHRMPLIEVVRGAKSGDAAVATAVAFARRLGKTPVVTNDAPGFIVNRLLTPYLREAVFLLEEGFAIADIDAAMRRFGMPMGPFEVVDEVGLDVGAKVGKVLGAAFPTRMALLPSMARMAESGRLGRKSGLGFYRHHGRRRTPDPAVRTLLGLPPEKKAEHPDALAERMALAMVNEAAYCLADGVVSEAGAIDLAMIFGAGFPPFRGGPLRYADTLGLAHVVTRLRALRAEKGERFEPAPLLVAKAERGDTFTQPVVN